MYFHNVLQHCIVEGRWRRIFSSCLFCLHCFHEGHIHHLVDTLVIKSVAYNKFISVFFCKHILKLFGNWLQRQKIGVL